MGWKEWKGRVEGMRERVEEQGGKAEEEEDEEKRRYKNRDEEDARAGRR